jgi:hypothetical protein
VDKRELFAWIDYALIMAVIVGLAICETIRWTENRMRNRTINAVLENKNAIWFSSDDEHAPINYSQDEWQRIHDKNYVNRLDI